MSEPLKRVAETEPEDTPVSKRARGPDVWVISEQVLVHPTEYAEATGTPLPVAPAVPTEVVGLESDKEDGEDEENKAESPSGSGEDGSDDESSSHSESAELYTSELMEVRRDLAYLSCNRG